VNVETVPIDSIHVDPANVRVHPERNLATIKASLARFGQQKPLVVDGDGIVRAGNGTLEAARALGWETVNVVRTPLTGSEATAYAIADNRTAELAEWAYEDLGNVIRSLQAEDFDISVLGFVDHELEPILAANWSPLALEELPGEQDTGTEQAKPHAVIFSAEAWETIQDAVGLKRDQQQNAELTESQCLELICAGFLTPQA
jgi:ParB-like chromosome segregation protein Spo0J